MFAISLSWTVAQLFFIPLVAIRCGCPIHYGCCNTSSSPSRTPITGNGYLKKAFCNSWPNNVITIVCKITLIFFELWLHVWSSGASIQVDSVNQMPFLNSHLSGNKFLVKHLTTVNLESICVRCLIGSSIYIFIAQKLAIKFYAKIFPEAGQGMKT